MTGWRGTLCLFPVLSLASHHSLQHLFFTASAAVRRTQALKTWLEGLHCWRRSSRGGLPLHCPLRQPHDSHLGYGLARLCLLHPLSASPMPPCFILLCPGHYFSGSLLWLYGPRALPYLVLPASQDHGEGQWLLAEPQSPSSRKPHTCALSQQPPQPHWGSHRSAKEEDRLPSEPCSLVTFPQSEVQRCCWGGHAWALE